LFIAWALINTIAKSAEIPRIPKALTKLAVEDGAICRLRSYIPAWAVHRKAWPLPEIV